MCILKKKSWWIWKETRDGKRLKNVSQVGHFLQWSKQGDDTGSKNEEESDLKDIFEIAALGNRVLSMPGVKEVKDDT